MCGRFTLTERDLAKLARGLGAELDPALAASWRPRFNVAPGSSALLVREDAGGSRRIERARFGWSGVGAAKLLINARLETVAERRAFRAAWATRRCVIPADGFFEWAGPPRARRPLWFHDPAGRPLLFAALWGEFPTESDRAPTGGSRRTSADEGGETAQLAFSILTRPATGAVASVHDRMPVIVPGSGLAAWLGGEAEPPAAADDSLAPRPVSDRVNSIANDDPGCLEPAPADRQLALF